jgi:Coenzyme A transferase
MGPCVRRNDILSVAADHECKFVPFSTLPDGQLAVKNAGDPFDVIDKQVKTTADAVAGVRDGSTVLVAGFGAVGVADTLLDAPHEQGARELTGMTPEKLQALTEPKLQLASDWRVLTPPEAPEARAA